MNTFTIIAFHNVNYLLQHSWLFYFLLRLRWRNEDIRDAILSLANMFRDTGDKLERHEYRERQLGEQLKKALVGLDKRHRTTDHNLDAISQVVNRLDDRLLNIEKMIAQASDVSYIVFYSVTVLYSNV